ncbi:MAG: AsmA family protein [Sideroxydans sp.]
MNKYLKYALWVVGGAFLLFAGVLAYVALTFDPNAYKPQIVQAVKDNTQRTLKLGGDIKLTFFPNIGARLGAVSLSEFQSDQEFASIESADVSLALWPLLSGQVVVNQIVLSGVRLQVIRHKDGKLNLDDLLGQKAAEARPEEATPAKSPVKFDVAAVRIDKTDLSYRDESAGTQYRVSEMSLATGRIANAIPSKIEMAAHILTSEPKLDVMARCKGEVFFDLDRTHYGLHGLELQVSGSALDITDLALKVGGEIEMHPAAREFAVSKLSLAASGIKGREPFEARLDLPQAALLKSRLTGSGLAMNAKLNAAIGKIDATLSLPSMESNLQEFRLHDLSVNVGMKQPAQAFDFKVVTTAVGNLQTQQYNLSDMRIVFNAIGSQFPGSNVKGELKGGVRADLERESVQGNLAGKFLQSQLKAKAAVNNFKQPRIRYDLEIDRFDADPFIPQKDKGEAKPKPVVAEQPFDLSFLKPLDIEGSLRLGALKAANIKASRLRVDVRAKNGVATLAPLAADLYQGSMTGKVVIDANHSTFAVDERITGVAVGSLLRDALDKDIAEGRGDVVVALQAAGQTVSAVKQSLQGKVSVNLADGAIKGIDLAKLVQGIQRLNKDTRIETLGVNQNEKTSFSEFKASFIVRDGVAHNDDLAVRSTVLRLTGSGDIDIGHDRMEYNAQAIFAKTEQGGTATLPVSISGPFDALKIKVDYGALLMGMAKQKLDEKKEVLKENAKTKLQDELKKGLKGLFK